MRYLRVLTWIAAFVLGLLLQSPFESNVARADEPDGEKLVSSKDYCGPGVPCDSSLSGYQRAQRQGSPQLDPHARPEQMNAPSAKGGPDAFGYKWNDNIPFNWIDATDGVDTGMTGRDYGQVVEAPLNFKFRFYEKTFKKVQIAASGFLTFDDPVTYDSQSRIPLAAPPNNIIAPYWTPTYLDNASRVYYKSGGVKPDRYFIVQWHNLRGSEPSDSIGADELYRFQVVLFENGQILFQYDQMSYADSYYCASEGIEDSLGIVGLPYLDFCSWMPSQKAVQFTRPKPAARVSILPKDQGSFAAAGEAKSYEVLIRNTGDKGTDTFDITLTGAYSPTLFMSDGVTPLADTDSDTIPDTGPVKQGKKAVIVVQVQTPGNATAGDFDDTIVTVTSSINTLANDTALLRTATASEFAQVFTNRDDGAMSLDLVGLSGQQIVKVTSDNYYGSDPGIVRSPNGNFLNAWTRARCVDQSCNYIAQEIEYSLRDSNAQPLSAIKKVKPLGAPTMDIYQYYHGLGVAPNGMFGVSFVQEIVDPNQGLNENVWFALVNDAGKTIKRINVTQNNSFGYSLYLYNTRVAGAQDNRFVVVWQREMWLNNDWVNDIFYAVYDAAGNPLKAPTKLSKGGNGKDFYSPTALTLQDGSILIAFTGYSQLTGQADVYLAVIDSAGNKIRKPKNLTKDADYDWYNIDAAQLNNDNILLAWNSWNDFSPDLRYVMLDSAFNMISGPAVLDNPAAILGDGPPSIAPDSSGNAIVTWFDDNFTLRRNLYYALVDGSGNVTTPPTIFQTSSTRIESNFGGHGNSMR